MRESEVEKQFVEAVRAVGGQALKFTSQSMNGVPDRLVLLLGGKCAFVELKAPGKQMRILQRKRRQQLEALGFPVFCVDRLEQIQPVYDENGKARIIHDHKLEALEDLIEAANGQPVLVAYWFKHDRQRIIDHLTHLKIPVRDIKSSTDIKDWNAGNIPVAVREGVF